MKMVMIVVDEARKEELEVVLERAGVAGYTELSRASGRGTTGPRLGPNGLPYAAFARYVRAPRLQMPPYTDKILPDADLADLYAFVQSRPKAATPPALK